MAIALVVILAVVALGMWLMRSGGAGPRGYRNNRQGGARSTYDDPNFRSGGTIGGPGGTYQDAGYRPTSRPERGAPSRPAYDDEEFRSGGSIGG